MTTDTRYPYTYACDLIRAQTRTNQVMSRADASLVRQVFAEALGLSDEELAKKLADYYLSNQERITEESVQRTLAAMRAKYGY